MNIYKTILFGLFTSIILLGSCVQQQDHVKETVPERQLPPEIPKGILIDKVPENADIIFDSIRYVLSDTDCLNADYTIKKNFITDARCNKHIYNSNGSGLGSPKQLFTMDLETGNIIQVTNTDWFFSSGQVVDPKTIMACAACSDTDNDGIIGDSDKKEIYYLNLIDKSINCLTCEYGFSNINNPDYSPVADKVLFSGALSGWGSNKLFTIDSSKNLVQITDDKEFTDFDPSWSEDGRKIVFSRLPQQDFPWSIPSQIWLINADGTNPEKITAGGTNPENEKPQGPYPIGIDADPDLSPDNRKIVFSRLKTAQKNVPFGVYELIIIDMETRQEQVIDSQYANMLPQWKSKGILFIRQTGSNTVSDKSQIDPMSVKQSLYMYRDGAFQELEGSPYNVFPVGAYGASWIE